MLGQLFSPVYETYKASGFARVFKLRRYRRILATLGVEKGASILDVGCGTGADFSRFAVEDGFRCSGIDISKQAHLASFDFRIGRAEELPFPDQHFDAAVSVGVFEHVQPIESLCVAATEIARVAKSFCVLVPSAGTWIEPHTLSPFWQSRGHTRKSSIDYALNFLSDEAWLQLKGFAGAHTARMWYLPGIQNLLIYRSHRDTSAASSRT